MKRILYLALLLSASMSAWATCPASYAFPGSAVPLNASDFTQTTATGSVSALNENSGTTEPATASTQGMAIWVGASCSPGNNQYATVTPTTALTGTTGPMVRADSAGDGYVWILGLGLIYKLSALAGAGSVVSCPGYTLGHTYQLAAFGTSITGYDNGVEVCTGTDSTYSTGSPGLIVDKRSGTTDSLSTFVTGVSTAPPLPNPSFSLSTAVFSSGGAAVLGSSVTYNVPIAVQILPSNYVAWQGGATAYTNCYLVGGGTPTATVAGTCDPPATTYTTFNVSVQPFNSIAITASTTICAIATAVGFTNSSPVCSTITIAPFMPAPALSGTTLGSYSYSPLLVTLTGNMGSNLIYTTNGSNPAVSGPCSSPTIGTAAANGVQITLPNSATTPVKFAPCVGGVLGTIQTGVYTQTSAKTVYIRTDGGSRYSANVTTGQCNGLFDASYASTGGTGTNQNCAFNDFRYAWMDGSYGNSEWMISGGDTVVIRGCTALSSQQNPDNPHCRIGSDNRSNTNIFCQGLSGFWGCDMMPPPSGSASQNTKILGGCAFGTYTCTPISPTTGYPYTGNNLTQLFSGWDSGALMWLHGSSNITIEGLELTTHNGACTTLGAPQWPRGCNTSSPIDDFGHWGIVSNANSSNITLQDVYIHGFTNLGLGIGPFYGTVSLTRVFIGFNALAGWLFDDNFADPETLPTSSVIQSQVTMMGNGCLEQYPITNTAFPALACWDSATGGFGDSWSGQNSLMDQWTCDKCLTIYNTKDGTMGPHTLISNLSMTNSTWIGNMGAQWKIGMQQNSNTAITSNMVLANCQAMGAQLPGAAQNFAQTTGLNGSYLGLFCRAGPVAVTFFADQNSSVLFNNNDIITYANTIMEIGCGTIGTCNGANSYNMNNNIFLGYTVPTGYIPGGNGQPPGVFYLDDGSVNINCSHNIGFGVRDQTPCNTTTIANTDPLFVGEPAQGSVPPESALYGFNFNPSSSSPARNAGVAPNPTNDAIGNLQTTPPTIGALVFASGTPTVATPTFSPVAGAYGPSQTVAIGTATGGASLIYTNDTSTPTVTALTCTITHGTLYTGPLTISTSQTLNAIGCLSGDNASSMGTAAYVINGAVANPTCTPTAGTYSSTQSVTCSSATGGSTTVCTIDGSTPTHGSPACSSISVASTLTLKALSFETGWSDSSVISNAYTITGVTVHTLSFGATLSLGAVVSH